MTSQDDAKGGYGAVITAIDDGTTGIGIVDEPVSAADSDSSSPEARIDATTDSADHSTRATSGATRWIRVCAYGLLPGLALVLACSTGYLKWQSDSAHDAVSAQTQSVAAATESTIALLTYRPDTADMVLTAARDRLTGDFRDSYSALIHDVVIPGAQQKQVSAVATVPTAASMSATANHAVVLVFVDQSITVGAEAPTSTASSVKVTLDKVGDRWLISDFTPV